MRKNRGESALEYLMVHAWAVLLIVFIVSAFYWLGIGNPETYVNSHCSGFSYFLFEDQKLSDGQYTIQVRGRSGSITIRGVQFGNSAMDASPDIVYDSSRDSFIITTESIPPMTEGSAFRDERVRIMYDARNGIQNSTDSALCSGRSSVDNEWSLDLGNVTVV